MRIKNKSKNIGCYIYSYYQAKVVIYFFKNKHISPYIVFNYALLNIDRQYLLENHIISIFYEDDNLSKDEILKKLNNIIKSFKQKRTSKFVDIFSGTNSLNTTEIQNMLPIYGF